MSAVGRFLRRFAIALLFVFAAASGTVAGVLVVYTSDLPQISALDDYAPSTITRVYSAGGEVVGEFATQRRIVISYDQIPPVLRQAIMAAEDAEFDTHMGLSITRIIVTLAKDLIEGKRAGASTLTQQLTRKLFLNDDKTWERKIKEAVLAIQIEKRYTKPEIVTLYCNQIPWGHGTYGAEAAARLYFGKSAKDVTLEEAALLAGIIQAPARHSPYVNLQNAMRRRNYALGQMADAGFITRERAEQAKKAPIVTVGRPALDTDAAFFVEEVRQQIEERYGAQQLYENGLAVYTTLDLKLQHAAEAALAEGMRRIDRRRGFRKPVRIDAAAIESYTASELDGLEREGWRPAGGRVGRRRRDRRRRTDRCACAPAPCTASWRAPTTPGPARRPAPSSRPATSCACWSPRSTRRRRRSPARSIRSRSSRARCSRCRTAPAGCWRWSAAAASS